ncbi:MAG: SGNH/GDSL hydrolase family protein [Litoreibacter sp.]|nr:SGNH/GDSL hydrolase family protein [Litoreibacter sp.]
MKEFLVAGAVALCTTTASFATTITDAFSSFVILGDSLSDNGNLFASNPAFVPSPPYVEGRFSNGPVWNEGIVAGFAPGTTANLAFGGATTSGGSFAPPSLDEQLLLLDGAIATSLSLGTTPLVSIWAGANDIRNAVLGAPLTADAVAKDAAANVLGTIGALAGKGINDFVVFNLPDLGATAEANIAGYGPIASPATASYNSDLAAGLALLEASGTNIIEVDIFSLFSELIADPASFGVDDATGACILNPTTCNPDTWLFWDGIHPTAFGHSLIQDEVIAAIEENLAPVPLPATAPLLLAGLGLIGWTARRKACA